VSTGPVDVSGKPVAKALADGIEVWCTHERLLPVEDLKASTYKLNRHSDVQIELLAREIWRRGWRKPLIVSSRSGRVIDGHARLVAAKSLGVGLVPVEFQHFASQMAEDLFHIPDILKRRYRRRPNLKVRRGSTKNCPICEFPFYVPPSASGKIYCSVICKTFASRRHPRFQYSCLECSRLFTAPLRPKSNNANHYCSLHCRNLAYRQLKEPKSRSWKGGLTAESTRDRGLWNYREWRRAVFHRDKYTCQHCGAHGVRLHAHHIQPFAKFPELRFDIPNGMTLCLPCHGLVHNRKFHR